LREAICRSPGAVFWVTPGSARWRFLPVGYGEWSSVCTHFAHWDGQGIWARRLEQASDDLDLKAVTIAATVVRARLRGQNAPKI
jgi:transposase